MELITRCHTRIESEIDPQIETLESIERTRGYTSRPPTSVPTTVPAAPASSPDTIYRSFAKYARDLLIVRYDAIATRRTGLPRRGVGADRAGRREHALRGRRRSDPAHVPDADRATDRQVPPDRRVGALRQPDVRDLEIPIPDAASDRRETDDRKDGTRLAEDDGRVVDVVADTYGGTGDLSWQAINWSTPDTLALWFDLAAEAYTIQTEAAAATVLAASNRPRDSGGPATPAARGLDLRDLRRGGGDLHRVATSSGRRLRGRRDRLRDHGDGQRPRPCSSRRGRSPSRRDRATSRDSVW